MEEIIILSKLINQQKGKDCQLFPNHNHGRSLIEKLYNAACSGTIKSDEEACLLLYNNLNKTKNYRNVKFRLKNRLFNHLFLIDTKSFSNSRFEIIKYEAYKSFSLYKILFNRNKRILGVKLAEKVFKTSVKYGFTDLSIIAANDLRIYYGIINLKRKKEKFFSLILKNLRKLQKNELFVDKYYILLAQELVKSKALSKPKFLDEVGDKINKIVEIQKKYPNYILSLRAFNTIYFYYYLKRDIGELKGICRKALKFFHNKRQISLYARFDFKVKLAHANLNSREYEEAHRILVNCIKMNPTKGTLHWYNAKIYLFLVLVILEKYNRAYSVFSEAFHQKNLKRISASFSEPWYIKEAYVNFLIRMGKIDPSRSSAEPLRPFRLGRFLNEVPTYSQDKRGLNIAILIIQMLFLILDRKYSHVVDRIDALKLYSYRYLRQDETFRSNCFIKMLTKIPDANYHPEALKRHTDNFHKRLISVPMEISVQAVEIEIIPYENLWEIVLELLEKRRRGRL